MPKNPIYKSIYLTAGYLLVSSLTSFTYILISILDSSVDNFLTIIAMLIGGLLVAFSLVSVSWMIIQTDNFSIKLTILSLVTQLFSLKVDSFSYVFSNGPIVGFYFPFSSNFLLKASFLEYQFKWDKFQSVPFEFGLNIYAFIALCVLLFNYYYRSKQS